jgi:hypothetical protein
VSIQPGSWRAADSPPPLGVRDLLNPETFPMAYHAGHTPEGQQAAGTPATPDWAGLFLALSEQAGATRPGAGGACPSDATILARLDGAEEPEDVKALLLTLVALRLAGRTPPPDHPPPQGGAGGG